MENKKLGREGVEKTLMPLLGSASAIIFDEDIVVSSWAWKDDCVDVSKWKEDDIALTLYIYNHEDYEDGDKVQFPLRDLMNGEPVASTLFTPTGDISVLLPAKLDA